MEEILNKAMVLFGQYRSTGNVDLLYQALADVNAYLRLNPDNQKAIDLKRDIEAALQNAR